MLRASVAQNPTIAVTHGRKSEKENGCAPPSAVAPLNIAPIPPAFVAAHQKSANPATMSNGADNVSNRLMDSVPFQTKYRFITQKMRKPRYCGSANPMNCQSPPSGAQPGHRMEKIS